MFKCRLFFQFTNEHGFSMGWWAVGFLWLLAIRVSACWHEQKLYVGKGAGRETRFWHFCTKGVNKIKHRKLRICVAEDLAL